MRRGVVAAVVVALAGCGSDGAETVERAFGPGDPDRGKAVYERSGCAACHSFSGYPGGRRNVGPNLDVVARKYDPAFIRTSIVDPSAFLEKGSEGRIGGSRAYSNSMPAYGPKELPPQHLTEQQLRDLVAFIERGGSR